MKGRANALENLQLVINDCNDGANYTESGEQIPWDVDGWNSMAELLEEVQQYILENTPEDSND